MVSPDRINQARALIGISHVASPFTSQPKNLTGNDLANHYLSIGEKTAPTPKTPAPGSSIDSTINPTSIKNTAKDYFGGLNDTYSKAPGELGTDVSKIADTFKSDKPGELDSFGSMVKKSMAIPNLLGDSLKTIFAPISQGISTGVKTTAKALGDDPGLQKIASNPEVSQALDFINTKGDELNQIQADHPEAAHAINSLLTIAASFLGEGELNKPVSQIKNELIQKGKNVVDVLKGPPPSGPANEYINGTVNTMKQTLAEPGFTPSAGENPIATVQKNIVDGISGAVQGVNPEAVKQIAGLDPSTFKTVDDFAKAANDIMAASGSAAQGAEAAGGRGVLREPVAAGGAIDAVGEGQNLADRVRLYVAEKNVGPQLETSARRLAGDKFEPVDKYNKAIEQQKKFSGDKGKIKGDIKQDTAIGKQGEEIGNEFDKIVAQRRAVGAKMGEELKKVGGIKTDISEPVNTFKQEMYDNIGLNRDPKTGNIKPVPGAQSRLSADDTNLITKYETSLDTLGPNPTIKNLDNFISRTTQDIDLYKGSKGITQTTNAERIIKNNLRDLREQFNPQKTGNPKLQAYYDARNTYHDLSDFLDEGIKYLGQKTQAGDYQKDASLLKSSVQSILNNGKKDWLLKLEGLTGYPALDNAVINLQAMKDLGDFRGQSLLNLLSEGNIPTSPTSIFKKALDYLAQKGVKLFTGSPEDQTRLFLQSLSEKK